MHLIFISRISAWAFFILKGNFGQTKRTDREIPCRFLLSNDYLFNDANTENAFNCFNRSNDVLADVTADIYQSVSQILLGLALHILNVQSLVCKLSSQWAENVWNVLVQNADSGAACITTHGAVREVYGVGDVTVLQVILQLICSHGSAVVLGFRCGSAQVRDSDYILYAQQLVVCKVGYIRSNLTLAQSSRISLL